MGNYLDTWLDEYVVLDLETTGFSAARDAIIDIGAARIVEGRVVEEFSQLINPDRPVSRRITQLTGITNDMLDGQPSIETVLPEFLDRLGSNVLLGHNISFDLGFLNHNAQLVVGHPLPNDYMDTMRLSRKLFPQERTHKLEALIRRFDIADVEEHRGLSDAIQTAQCYEYMKRFARGC
ncbi:DNA polymerase III subunit epsilon [Bifidobacterium lemurum]|uniref:DNA polymerase III subunit epsilon n=1 Tax=Bifidobacterium lemurum TaxID=1603886 RepID=A0A261FRR5_9BIFI|nr:3'-5' exonuclease [Bifidobacterium lemurum]OZG61496.1 DNA polymerase III subunit epsilon [Bifidobacterium lemurum]QOL35083.1 3'-5' exonuclease [Bifidobacterium lemurum]